MVWCFCLCDTVLSSLSPFKPWEQQQHLSGNSCARIGTPHGHLIDLLLIFIGMSCVPAARDPTFFMLRAKDGAVYTIPGLRSIYSSWSLYYKKTRKLNIAGSCPQPTFEGFRFFCVTIHIHLHKRIFLHASRPFWAPLSFLFAHLFTPYWLEWPSNWWRRQTILRWFLRFSELVSIRHVIRPTIRWRNPHRNSYFRAHLFPTHVHDIAARSHTYFYSIWRQTHMHWTYFLYAHFSHILLQELTRVFTLYDGTRTPFPDIYYVAVCCKISYGFSICTTARADELNTCRRELSISRVVIHLRSELSE
jgi:hypothetical protein